MPTPPFVEGAPVTITIFANASGSDVTGDGSQAAPFLTFQRAIRQVPLLPQPGVRYIVDITGLGVEQLPDGYALPLIQFPVLDYAIDTSIPFFYSGAGLRIRALPQLASTIPPADAVIDASAGATITADPDTNLITLTVPIARPSWTTANLRNKQILRTVGSFFAGAVITDATPNTLVITNNADNFNGGVGPLVLDPGEVLQIVEPSATLQGGADVPIDQFGDTFGAIQSRVNSIGFQGIRFTQPGSGFPIAIAVMDSEQTTFELCDIEGLFSQGDAGMYWTYLTGTVLRGNLLSVNSSTFTRACHIDSITLFYFANATPQSFEDTIVSSSASFSNGTQNGLPIVTNLAFQNVLIRDSNAGFSPSPDGDAIFLQEGRVQLTDVRIENAAGSAVHIVGSTTQAGLVHVTGVELGSFGVLAEDGAQASVDATTTVTGTINDTKSGSLAPTTYAQVAAGLAYDIPPNSPIAVSTGTRIFTK